MTIKQQELFDNLVTFVTNLLSKNNHPAPEGWYVHLHQDAFTTTDLSIQRFLINRAWRLIMSNVVEENTMDIRYCLIDNGEHCDWARLFETEVLPCIIKYNLPRTRH